MKKTITLSLILVSATLFTACTSSGSSLPMNAGTPSFKAGSTDGCATANGAYTKNHQAFKNDQNYQDGWFYGRKKCNPADARH